MEYQPVRLQFDAAEVQRQMAEEMNVLAGSYQQSPVARSPGMSRPSTAHSKRTKSSLGHNHSGGGGGGGGAGGAGGKGAITIMPKKGVFGTKKMSLLCKCVP